MATADGLNHLTGGLIPDRKSDVVHGLMTLSTLALAHKKTRAAGVVGWLGVIGLWAVGQDERAVRRRDEGSLCD